MAKPLGITKGDDTMGPSPYIHSGLQSLYNEVKSIAP
jgi:hypothetical protein